MSDPDKKPNDNGEETFVKNTYEDITEQIPPPVAETFKQKIMIWIVRLLFASMFPVSVGAGTYSLKYAELETANQRKRTKIELRQKQLQLQLLSQIIDVAKKADFKNPTSLYRLGLIAHMVNENHGVFGIELQDAEQTMKLMFARLAPISGLRKRIADANVMVTNIKERADAAKKNEDSLEDKILDLKKTYRVTSQPWLRRRLDAQLAEKKQELAIQRDRRRFFDAQLYRETQLKEYFQDQLDRQSQQLQTALQEASMVRDRLKLETNDLCAFIDQVEKLSPEAKKVALKMRVELRRVRENHQKAEQLVKQIQTELKSELEESKDLRYKLSRCQLEKAKPCLTVAPTKVPSNSHTQRKVVTPKRPRAVRRVPKPKPARSKAEHRRPPRALQGIFGK